MLPFSKPSGQWFQHGGGRANLTGRARGSTFRKQEEEMPREEMFKCFQEIFEMHLCGGRFDVEGFLIAQAAIKKALQKDYNDQELEEAEDEIKRNQQEAEDEKKQRKETMSRAERMEAMKKSHAKKVVKAKRVREGASAVCSEKMGLTEEETNAFVMIFFEICERTDHGRAGMEEVFKEFFEWQRRRLAKTGYNCKQVCQRLRKCLGESNGFKCEDENYDFPQLPLMDPYGDRRRVRVEKIRETKRPVLDKVRENNRKKYRDKFESEIEEAQKRTRAAMEQTTAARDRFLTRVVPLLTEDRKARSPLAKAASEARLPNAEADDDEPPPAFDSLLQAIIHKPGESPKKKKTLRKKAEGTQSLPTLTTTLEADTDRYGDYQRRQKASVYTRVQLPAIN